MSEEKIELSKEQIGKVVTILAREYPKGSKHSEFICVPYNVDSGATNLGLDLMEEAVKKETGLGYLAMIHNEHEIIPAYMKRIGFEPKYD